VFCILRQLKCIPCNSVPVSNISNAVELIQMNELVRFSVKNFKGYESIV
jgi:hypothetical protein